MKSNLALEALWNAVPPSGNEFDQARVLPESARRYLHHTIAPGIRPASAVRLRMHGEIKLKQWFPFTAEQVIRLHRGMIWSATVRMHGFPIYGTDRMIDGEGAMQWKLLGIFPMMTASGPDITRSAIGRVIAESVWLPPALACSEVTWTELDAMHPRAHLCINDESADLTLTIDETGRVLSSHLPRWGNPDGGAFHYVDFGGILDEEKTFDGYTIPTRVRVGWYFGTDRFASEGEFFRATIDEAIFR